MYVVAERLFITRQLLKLTILYELLFQKVINGRYAKVFAAVCFKDLQDRLLEWRDIKGFIFGKPGAGMGLSGMTSMS